MPDMAGRAEEYKSCIEIACKGKFRLHYTTRTKTRADTEATPGCSKVQAQLVRVAPAIITSSANKISLPARQALAVGWAMAKTRRTFCSRRDFLSPAIDGVALVRNKYCGANSMLLP